MDPRHEHRIKIVQELYGAGFVKQPILDEVTKKILKKDGEIEKLIKKYAKKFPLDKIARVDLAILKLAIYELVFEKSQPPKVIINEGVELARQMGSDKSYGFVNAVLGKIYTEISISKK